MTDTRIVSMIDMDVLSGFHPAVRSWFLENYPGPTPPQTMGWPSIAAGQHTLILAPTGSGKTLAAFLWAINHLVDQHERETLAPGVRILYISPLKALNNDIERNLEQPLHGIQEHAVRLGVRVPPLTTAVRTGDTPQAKRESILKHPPDILITTPESLYLMLTAQRARRIFQKVQYVIIDEIHSLCANKRGVHLSLSLERLQETADQEFVRIGLSATQKPLDRVAAYLGGLTSGGQGGEHTPRPVCIVDTGSRKQMDLRVECPVTDFSSLSDEGAWPAIHEALLQQIRTHRTTLIFVNNRRLAERIAAAVNALTQPPGTSAPTQLYAVPLTFKKGHESDIQASEDDRSGVLVQAYHGSMSREAREEMERALKQGAIRALAATSSLELGIDIGSIDLVVQIESPKGIARGLQRVGRSGHVVHAVSKGSIVPTHREQLVECAVVARAMIEGDIEPVHIPENCLDVLAQQIVAAVSVEPWSAEAMYDLIRRSYCYRALPQSAFDSVLAMVSGRYTDPSFRELRARISWDKIHGTLAALPGSGHLAITSGGTISDRGYYAVTLEDGRTRVGEVDEEFVYETRVGDTFMLGSSVWRVAAIDRNRVTVAPAPGQPARMPFWKGEGIGRTYGLGQLVGRFQRTVAERIDDPGILAWLRQEYPIDDNTAWNILDSFRRQRDVAGVIPHDRVLLIEAFRDEIGDPRLVLHSPFGRSINGLLGLLLARKVREETGSDAQMLFNDDGVILRTSDMEELPLSLFDALTPERARAILLEEIAGSPLFAGHFRQNAARALLMPRLAPGKRTPLWLQRLRAGDLFEAVRRHSDFPIVLETMREVLADVLNVEGCLELLAKIQEGEVRIERRMAEMPSPFATGILFDFIAVYMYAGDAAPSVSEGTAIDGKMLGEMLPSWDRLASVLKPEAIEEVEQQLQHCAPGSQARSAEELMQIVLRLGDLTATEIARRCAGDAQAMMESLARAGRIVPIHFSSEERWIAAEDRELYSGLDDDRSAGEVLQRFVRSHGPITSSTLGRRYGLAPERLRTIAGAWLGDRTMVQGRFSATATAEDPEWCYRPTMERIHRYSIGLRRKEIIPSLPREFCIFLQEWTGVSTVPAAGSRSVGDVMEQFEGLPLPIESWERDILFPRIAGFRPEDLRSLTRSGTLVWQGCGSGRARPLFRDHNVFPFGPADGADEVSDASREIMEVMKSSGAVFFQDLRARTRLSVDALNSGLAQLFWLGRISNDALEELLALKRIQRTSQAPTERIQILSPRHNPSRARLMGMARKALRQIPGWTGRWFLLDHPGEGPAHQPQTDMAVRQVHLLLERYGILAREFLAREDTLPWSALAPVLQSMELRGEVRRGYFVQGLSGMQYALPEAADMLRRSRAGHEHRTAVLLIPTIDPANPFGPGLPLPGHKEVRVSRTQGSYLAFADGSPFLLIEGNGARCTTIERPDDSLIRKALLCLVGLLRRPEPIRPFSEIVVEYWNDRRPADSPAASILSELHFGRDKDQTMRLDTFTL